MACKKYFYEQNSLAKMPWGKHKGKRVRDIPIEYVKWAILNFEDCGMADMFSLELQRRYPKYKK